MKEVWRDIKGYKGLYQVSNLGRVKSLPRKYRTRENILKLDYIKGYYRVTLCNNGEKKHHLVHRLVYEAFYGKIPFWMEINHKDENPINNIKNNLMICNRSQNINWGTRNIKIKYLLGKKILQFDLEGNFIKEWESQREIEKQTGYDDYSIGLCCKGKLKTCGGYIWKYKKAV